MAGPSSQITQGFRINKHYLGAEPQLEGTAGGTIAVGDWLQNASGVLTVADNAEAAELAGMATMAAVSGGRVIFTPIWDLIVWEATLDGGTTTGTALTVATHKYQQYGLGKDAGNGKFFINFDDTTAKHFTIIDFVDPVGTVRGRVLAVSNSNFGLWGV